MLYSQKTKDIISKQKPISIKIVKQVKDNLSKKGVVLEQSEEIDKILILHGKEAVVYAPGNTILMHTKVSASGFYEELIHYGQFKRGGFDISSPKDILELEIETQEKLIKFRKAYKIPDEEIQILTENLDWYKMKLEEFEKGGH
jgi:hypothetical protein